jgi:hypothetical protein
MIRDRNSRDLDGGDRPRTWLDTYVSEYIESDG